MEMALLPLIKPTTFETAYFGGILMHIWTWSGIRCPSSILQPFCLANSWNNYPRRFRNLPNITFFLLFGINTMWYLQFHFVWLKLWYSLIGDSPYSWSSFRESSRPTYRSNLCESPGIAGGLPYLISVRTFSNTCVELILYWLLLQILRLIYPLSGNQPGDQAPSTSALSCRAGISFNCSFSKAQPSRRLQPEPNQKSRYISKSKSAQWKSSCANPCEPVRLAAIAEPDLGRYIIRLSVWVIHSDFG